MSDTFHIVSGEMSSRVRIIQSTYVLLHSADEPPGAPSCRIIPGRVTGAASSRYRLPVCLTAEIHMQPCSVAHRCPRLLSAAYQAYRGSWINQSYRSSPRNGNTNRLIAPLVCLYVLVRCTRSKPSDVKYKIISAHGLKLVTGQTNLWT